MLYKAKCFILLKFKYNNRIIDIEQQQLLLLNFSSYLQLCWFFNYLKIFYVWALSLSPFKASKSF